MRNFNITPLPPMYEGKFTYNKLPKDLARTLIKQNAVLVGKDNSIEASLKQSNENINVIKNYKYCAKHSRVSGVAFWEEVLKELYRFGSIKK
jgi:hypothetical protein